MKIKVNKSTIDSSVLNFKNYIEQVVLNQTESKVVKRDDHINRKSTDMVLLKPTMKFANRLLKFLSVDLLNKTLKVFIYKCFNVNNYITQILFCFLELKTFWSSHNNII